MKDIFRKQLQNMVPYVQGKPAEVVQREYGLDRIEKLASNENLFGPSPKAIEAIKQELSNVNFYAEGHPKELVDALADYYGIDPKHVVIGIGGEGLIWNLSMCLLDEGDEVVTAVPTFDIYKLTATFHGAKTIQIPVRDGVYDIEAMVAAVTDRTKILWLCTPNNPTAHIASRQQLDYLFDNVPEDVVIVLDEAYYDFACTRPDYPTDSIKRLQERENLAILRTPSKVWGLAGLRLGWLLTSPTIVSKVMMVRQSLGLGRLSIAGVKAALTDDAYLRYTVNSNREAIDYLETYFTGKGWNYYPSYSNFVWADCGTGSKEVFEQLQQKGVIIRPGFLWGWDNWIRVSTGTAEQMHFFTEKLDTVIAGLTRNP
jgi:histidinol-phosphate aminotransferase